MQLVGGPALIESLLNVLVPSARLRSGLLSICGCCWRGSGWPPGTSPRASNAGCGSWLHEPCCCAPCTPSWGSCKPFGFGAEKNIYYYYIKHFIYIFNAISNFLWPYAVIFTFFACWFLERCCASCLIASTLFRLGACPRSYATRSFCTSTISSLKLSSSTSGCSGTIVRLRATQSGWCWWYTLMLGCSMRRFSKGDVWTSMGPDEVKMGGGVMNQDSSMWE